MVVFYYRHRGHVQRVCELMVGVSRLREFRVELARCDSSAVRLFAVSTRLFFASIWVAGTVCATSLGWTAVTLVGQRVGDEPVIEQSLAVLPLKTNDSPSTEDTASSETVNPDDPVTVVPTDLVFDQAWVAETPTPSSTPSPPSRRSSTTTSGGDAITESNPGKPRDISVTTCPLVVSARTNASRIRWSSSITVTEATCKGYAS